MYAAQALAISLIVLILDWAESWFAYPLVNVPLVLCPIVGLIMGNFTAGIVAGGVLQLVFMGETGIGSTKSADVTLGSVIGTALALAMKKGVGTALAFAVPIAALGSFLTLLVYFLRGLFIPLVERFCDRGEDRKIELIHFLIAFLSGLPKALLLFLSLFFGFAPAERLAAMLPQTAADGLTYASGLLPAVGIALLLKMMWSKKMAVYFFAGFLLAAYLKIPIIGVAALGAVLAAVLLLEERAVRRNAVQPEKDAEEELFDD